MVIRLSFSGLGFWPWFLAGFAMLLVIGDALTTCWLLGTRNFVEGNPVIAWLMDRIGSWWIAVKLLVTAGIFVWMVGRWEPMTKVVMLVMLATMIFVVGRHIVFIWGMTT